MSWYQDYELRSNLRTRIVDLTFLQNPLHSFFKFGDTRSVPYPPHSLGAGIYVRADEALRQAKLDFRNHGNDAKKHPYYWAAFIHTGNPPTGQSKASGATIWYLLFGALLVISAIFLYRSNGKKSSN